MEKRARRSLSNPKMMRQMTTQRKTSKMMRQMTTQRKTAMENGGMNQDEENEEGEEET
jgi:hypothetical protein